MSIASCYSLARNGTQKCSMVFTQRDRDPKFLVLRSPNYPKSHYVIEHVLVDLLFTQRLAFLHSFCVDSLLRSLLMLSPLATINVIIVSLSFISLLLTSGNVDDFPW